MMNSRRKAVMLASLLAMVGCSFFNSSTGNFVEHDGTEDPDAVFRDHRTEVNIYWSRPPHWSRYDDVVRMEESCETKELVCIEFPFPLIIPKELGVKQEQRIIEGQLEYYALTGPNAPSDLCSVQYFTVVTSLDGSEQWNEFHFSREKGLERIALLMLNKFGETSLLAVYDRVSGRIFAHEDICN